MSDPRIEETGADLASWIDGATFYQVRVTIHRNPALWADLAPLYDRIAAAEERLAAAEHRAAGDREQTDATLDGTGSSTVNPPDGDAALGETATEPASVTRARAELDTLTADAAEIYARYDADAEVWTLRALDVRELIELTQTHPQPEVPKRREGETKAAYDKRLRTHHTRAAGVRETVNDEALSRAVVSVEIGGRAVRVPTAADMARLRARPHGDRHYAELLAAFETITTREMSIPAPHRSRV